MEIRAANIKLITSVKGSWETAAGYLAMTVNALRNRAYEVKGQVLTTEHSLALQELSGAKYFAQAVAAASGGTFVLLPEARENGNEEISQKFRDLYIELGTFSQHFSQATADDVIDHRERALLAADGQRMHQVLSELLALTFQIYCPNGTQRADVPEAP